MMFYKIWLVGIGKVIKGGVDFIVKVLFYFVWLMYNDVKVMLFKEVLE